MFVEAEYTFHHVFLMPVREKIEIHVSAPLLVSIFSAGDEAAASAISLSTGEHRF